MRDICGFVGHADETLVRAMTDALAHRGPDGEGIWELRRHLHRDGARFETECNTEFVLAMYERHGPFLARDRLGVKPLYYALHRGVLYFASEVKALLPALPRPQLRRDAVATYLTFLWAPDPSCRIRNRGRHLPVCRPRGRHAREGRGRRGANRGHLICPPPAYD